MSTQQMPVGVGAILQGRYRLTSDGISNDLGLIYDAYDLQRNQPVVVLVLSPPWGHGVEPRNYLEQVQQAVANLSASELVPFEDAGLWNGQVYLVRPYTEGVPLADLLVQAGRLDIDLAVELTIRLCETLAPVHRAGLVHGSLSPHSVIVKELANTASSPSRMVTLVDVGLLPALRPPTIPPGRPWGRFPYLSPEQAAGEDAHPASDVYVIGCLLYEMLAGRPPFRAGDEMVLALQHIRQEPPSLQILVPHAPPALAQIAHKALAKEPSARYRNAGQLAQILRSQLSLRPPSSQPDVLPPPAFPARERLVVPPPPVPSPADAWSSRAMYSFEEDEAGPEYLSGWSEEQPAGVDWLMIGLLIVALIAVLGLIPLWRTVYQRYAFPLPDSAPSSYLHLQGDPFLVLRGTEDLGGQGTGEVGVGGHRPVGLPAIAIGHSRARVPSPSLAVSLGRGKRSPDSGV